MCAVYALYQHNIFDDFSIRLVVVLKFLCMHCHSVTSTVEPDINYAIGNRCPTVLILLCLILLVAINEVLHRGDLWASVGQS